MRSPALRFLAFFGMCAIFGVAVWASEISRTQSAGQLAQTATTQSDKKSENSGQDVLCQPGQLFRVVVGKEVKKYITTPYRKYVCKETVETEADGKVSCEAWRCCGASGKCVGLCPAIFGANGVRQAEGQEFVNICKANYCKEKPLDKDCKTNPATSNLPTGVEFVATATSTQLASALLAQRAPGGGGKGCSGNCAAKALANAPPGQSEPGTKPSKPPQSTPLPGHQQPSLPGNQPQIPTGPPTTPTTPGGSTGGTQPSKPPPIREIENIGNSGNTSGGTQGGLSNGTGQTFKPSPFLNSLANWVTGNGGGSGGGGGGSNYSGGSIAYAPPTGPALVTNPNFESLSSQNTFAQPLETPYGSIAQLSKKSQLTAQERAILVLVDKFDNPNTRARTNPTLDTGVLKNSITDSTSNFVENVRDVISGVADFFVSMFVPSREKELTEEEKVAEEERRALRFFLETDEGLLVAGDPEALPTEIPDDALPAPQGPRGAPAPLQKSPFEASYTPPSAADDIATIADSPGQTTEGGETPVTEFASPDTESNIPEPSSDVGEGLEPESSEPQGVVATVKKAVGSLVSTVGGAIKSGFLRIVSWFF